jgi:hypothetical protein
VESGVFSDCSSSLCTADFIVKRGVIKIEAQPKVASKRNKERNTNGIINFKATLESRIDRKTSKFYNAKDEEGSLEMNL